MKKFWWDGKKESLWIPRAFEIFDFDKFDPYWIYEEIPSIADRCALDEQAWAVREGLA